MEYAVPAGTDRVMKLREDGIIQVKSRSLKKKKNPKLQIIDNIINSTLNMDDWILVYQGKNLSIGTLKLTN